MTLDTQALRFLIGSQHATGGWGHRKNGDPWVEPTAFALLALDAFSAGDSAAARKGLQWLRAQRRSDGGFSPHPVVHESTWVTALAVLVFQRRGELLRADSGLAWLAKLEGAESSWGSRLRRWLLGSREDEAGHLGWPWFPGAAAWVAPTALTILALRNLLPQVPHTGLASRVESARRFLLARRCDDGGWNHGSTRALGYEGDSYAETTGLGLLALQGRDRSEMAQSWKRGIALLPRCRSIEGWSWLQMGLRAHRVTPPPSPVPAFRFRNPREAAICLLARSAMKGADPWSLGR